MRILDPWSITDVEDYNRLIEVFGIEVMSEDILKQLPFLNRYFRRKIVFGHRDFQVIVKAIKNSEEYAVMSGIKPSSIYHLGSKITAEQIVYLQQLSKKARVFYAIADIEAWEDNGIPFEKSLEYAVDNVADLITLGLDLKRAYIYLQSREPRVLRWGYLFARGLTRNLLESIYGEKHLGMYMTAMVQVGDILLPQHPDFGGPKPTIVPVGVDQDPHIRLTRDLARKYSGKFKFVPPASVYHKLQWSLKGPGHKMSKRDPMSCLTLNDSPEKASIKIRNAFTGGRETAELQKKLGGKPEVCAVYQLALYHIDDDEKVRQIFEECKQGLRLCGECKHEVAELFANFLRNYQHRKKTNIERARRIIEDLVAGY
ncbi:MAG: tryptophan--tRNA ligase [Desulfurococcales archaeon ex4484_217_1]|nr:MAG: tryptophan--tRNA ligase [Desulfurococcales archaeon ex4484_217_1]